MTAPERMEAEELGPRVGVLALLAAGAAALAGGPEAAMVLADILADALAVLL